MNRSFNNLAQGGDELFVITKNEELWDSPVEEGIGIITNDENSWAPQVGPKVI